MTRQRTCVLPVGMLLVTGLAGCSQSPPPVVDEPASLAEKPEVAVVQPEPADDKELIQGTWLYVSHGTALIFDGDEVAFKETPESKSMIAYKLDPTKTPKHVDFIIKKDGNPLVNKGIYSLRGSILKVYFGKQPNHRPTEFSTKKAGGQEFHLLVSCRAGAEEAMDEIRKDGGEVTVDECSPDGAVLSIMFTGKIGRARLMLVKELTDLQTLRLLHTSITDEAVKKLQEALPNCKIIH